jgi:hypothetical protein
MFNLLMQGIPWEPGRGTMDGSRIFEYTDSEVAQQFKTPKGAPLLQRLSELPCLFMEEGTREELAYVGTITKVRMYGADIAFDYSLDAEVPPLTNSMIFANKIGFGMPAQFEFNRVHWAVKDADLYRTLLRLVRPRRQRPTVFEIPEHEKIEQELVSVMMPFSPAFDDVYRSVQEAATVADLRCRRADEIWEAPAIIQDVVSLIDRARVVVCDCSDRNPNVFYEIGIAHTLGREVVLLTQKEEDIPFDLRHLRYIPYRNNSAGRTKLSQDLGARLRAIANLD